MKIKDFTEKLGELDIKEMGIIIQFIGMVALMNDEDAKIAIDFFELLDKKIDENYIKRKKK